MNSQFAADVDAGLSKSPKTLSSKYFYDKTGDALFVKIMHSEEYYLTRAELEIFQNRIAEIVDSLELDPDTVFDVIELGAGDGLKTRYLLKALLDRKYRYRYAPVDISKNALDNLEASLKSEMPELDVVPLNGDYFDILDTQKDNSIRKLVLFLGSNLGNMPDALAADYIYRLGAYLKQGDMLLLGLDLIKSKEVVLPAYNDKEGYTKAFNLNLLTRINRELDGDFELKHFIHAPEYSEETGIAKSFLVSTKAQTVTIGEIGKAYHFEEGERIQTEISRKYTDDILRGILKDTDFKIKNKYLDSKAYFASYILLRN